MCTSHVIHGDVILDDSRKLKLKFVDRRCKRSTKSATDAPPTSLTKADRIAEERYEPRQLVRVVSDVVECLAVKFDPRQVWQRRTLAVRLADIMLADDRTAGGQQHANDGVVT